LPELTEGDLEKIGLPLGPRKRILKAIASLGSAQAETKPTSAPPTTSSTDAGERRQLTVMFCDLVGSTALAARLDPEDMGDLIRAFQGAVTAAVRRFDGHVAKWMGDGALVYFGYPRAHEDDAERAARAGLGIVEAVGGSSARARRCVGSARRHCDWPRRRRRVDGRGRGEGAASSARRPIWRRGCKLLQSRVVREAENVSASRHGCNSAQGSPKACD
jgi:Adenylate and Guanylate cyclase catalytic domain